MKKIILVMVFVLFSATGYATTYFLRADGTVTAATKANATGDAASTAMNITQHNAATFAAGDTIYLCDTGGEFREKLLPPSSGESGNNITYAAYTGDSPVINGSQLLANASFSLSSGQTYTYEISFTLPANTIAMVWEDDTRLTTKTSIAEVEATEGSFYQAASTVYIHPSDSSNIATNGKVYETPLLTECIDSNAKNYLTIRGIECEKTGSADGTVGGIKISGDYTTCEDLTTHNHRRHSFTFCYGAANCTATGINAYDNYYSYAVAMYGTGTDDNLITDSDIHDSSGLMIVHGASAIVDNPRRNMIDGCRFYNANVAGMSQIMLQYDFDTIIRNCHIYGTAAAYLIASNSGVSTRPLIYGNLIEHGNTLEAILMTAAASPAIYNNTIISTHASRYTVRFYNTSENITLKNNIQSGGTGLIQIVTDSTTGFASDNNCVYGATKFGMFDAVAKTLADWRTATSQDANSTTADPTLDTDYSLLAGSPCIKAGTRADVVGYVGNHTDYFGNSYYFAPYDRLNIGADQAGSDAAKRGLGEGLNIYFWR